MEKFQGDFTLGGRDNFEPVIVRIVDEIDAHFGIFKADAAHFLVLCVCRIEILRLKSKMEFIFAKVVGLLAVAQPSQLQCEIGFAVAQINQLPAAVGGSLRRTSFRPSAAS